MEFFIRLFLAGVLFIHFAQSQSPVSATCPSTLTPKFPAPSVAKGYVVRLVANGLSSPRKIHFDNKGHLLVADVGVGVRALTLKDSGGGCIQEVISERTAVVANAALNHGLELSADSKTLYASDSDKVYSWAYNSKTKNASVESTTLVYGMENDDHNTRSLLLSKHAPGMMVVNRGSATNLDYGAEDITTGRAQVRAFDISNTASIPYNFDTTGTLMGWGVRNDVGLAEEPNSGGIYSVENSVDQVERDGVDLHNTNPAEEMNYFGPILGPSKNRGHNFGYPDCFTAWNASVIPNFTGTTGQAFSNSTSTDHLCVNKKTPRLSFHCHNAPLDMLFTDSGSTAWITFHGSWDDTPATGYALANVQFSGGSPVAPSDSMTAAKYIAQAKNVGNCNSATCWRPVGLAWDKNGRLFMSSDGTGEIYAILKKDGTSVNS